MLILHTTLFQPQTDDLNETDLAAAWAILNDIKTPQMIIYNCGVESGSSQGHKHLQIFPRQDNENFSMWPSKVEDTDGISSPLRLERITFQNFGTGITTNIPGIPFKHFIIRLPQPASSSHICSQYQRLLQETKRTLRDANAGTDYNLILVREWLALIPRRSKGRGPFIANAANMVGLMWTRNEDVRDFIVEMGVNGLSELGIPVDH